MPKQNSSILFNRYIWLIDLIYSAGYITREEIDRRWSRASLNFDHESMIPERTFHRYKDAIQEMFQIDIRYNKSRGYYIENTEDIQRDELRQWLIGTFAVENLIGESSELRRRILLEDIPSGQRHLTPIIEAMRDGVKIRIMYQSFHSAEPSTFILAPYCVRVFRQRWYVLGTSEKGKELRLYGLDRILNTERTATPFAPPKDFDAEAFFANGYGVTVDERKPEIVRISVDAYQANYLRSLPIHPSQEETERNNDYSVFQFFIVPTYEFIKELLSYGGTLEVLSPKWLRKEIRQEARTMNEIYNGQENE
mgnify:FL=1